MVLRFSAPALFAVLACAAPAPTAQDLLAPAAHLGREVGGDFELADWNEVSGYFRHLGERSPRVQVETVGTTTEGRDFLLATISSTENLARLDEIRAAARRLADPRGMDDAERATVLATAKPIVFLSIAMHSTETAAPQFGMELAHLLATSDEEPFAAAREELVVLIAPCLNPDGLDHVVSWYRETVGGPFEGASLLKLYQLYVGHDNNRDWFMLSQNETRIVTRLLYSEWFPQVYWDVHQQGSSRERFFVPPFRDPLNPNLDPGIITGIDQLGTRALFDMTRAGFTGVSTGVSYDMWWNGGNRNVPVRHNIVGLLTEAASVNIGSPVFLPKSKLSGPAGIGEYAPSNRFPAPWPGGWWRLRDIIDYEHAFARSLLGSVSREPQLWLGNALAAAERSIAKGREDAPRAWILPADNRDRGAVRRLVDSLLLAGVEVDVADDEVAADGRTWPAGSIVIRRDQPYGQHVKDLFEVQSYPGGDAPYDVAGWTLPLLLGVRCVEVMEAIDPPCHRVTTAAAAVEGNPAVVPAGMADMGDSDTWHRAFLRLALPKPLAFGTTKGTRGLLHMDPQLDDEFLEEWTWMDPMPRIGLYAPWTGVMNEGWLRWVLEEFDVPYVTVRNEMIRAGGLDEFLDVLILPSVSGKQLDEGREPGTVPARYAGGLGAVGGAAIDEFVRGGGTLVTMGGSATWAIDLLDLPLESVVRDAEGFSCPGSVVRATPEDSVLTAGLPDSMAVFFSRSEAWEVIERESNAQETARDDQREVDVLLRYAPTRTLLSGWMEGSEVIEGKAAWVRATHGAGRVHLFGFRPQYRSWTQASFGLLFRALLLDR